MHYDTETLDDYLRGELPDKQDAAIHVHVAACAVCRAALDEAAALRDWIRSAALAEERELPQGVVATVRASAARERGALGLRFAALRRPLIAVPVAALLALAAYLSVPILRVRVLAESVAATYYLEAHAAHAAENPLADRSGIVSAAVLEREGGPAAPVPAALVETAGAATLDDAADGPTP